MNATRSPLKKTIHASEREREDVAKRRAEWVAAQPGLDPEKLVFVDETSTNTMMARLRGRSRRGHRVIASIPHGHWKTSTFVAGLRCDKITAPMVLDGAMDGAMFLAWIDTFLAPALTPGDIVIMDNLPAHKVAGVRERIEAAKSKVAYLPPYSCDFNPIEQVFAKLKALPRKAQERTLEALWKRTGLSLDQFQPAECANYLKNCGYASG